MKMIKVIVGMCLGLGLLSTVYAGIGIQITLPDNEVKNYSLDAGINKVKLGNFAWNCTVEYIPPDKKTLIYVASLLCSFGDSKIQANAYCNKEGAFGSAPQIFIDSLEHAAQRTTRIAHKDQIVEIKMSCN